MDTRVLFEFDILYRTGGTLFLTAQEGRDAFGLDEERLRIELRPDEATIEEYLIERSSIACLHTTRRVVPVDPATPLEAAFADRLSS
jgi:hypothetical protein